jgi:carbon storage regulator CsrA
MLVLTRKKRQQIQIGDNITVTILQVKGSTIRVGIDAPDDVRIVRGELTIDPEAPLTETAGIAMAAVERQASLSSAKPGRASAATAKAPNTATDRKLPPLANHMRLPSQGLGFSSVR